MQIVLAMLFCVCSVSARRGVDLSVVTDDSIWTCLAQKYNITFAIMRAYRSVGAVDINAAASISLAKNAGIKDVDAYMFPCISTSPYSLAHNITCASADTQVGDTVAALSSNGELLSKTMWIDVEEEVPSKYYDASKLYIYFYL